MIKKYRLEDMFRGWFLGDFDLAAFRTSVAEVAYMKHEAGEVPRPHHHKIGTEITVVVKGKVKINGEPFVEGDIFVIKPGESAAPEVIEDTEVVVVKVPSIPGDKYFDD
jgi:quercetin dioxygenase-like cupin family protein